MELRANVRMLNNLQSALLYRYRCQLRLASPEVSFFANPCAVASLTDCRGCIHHPKYLNIASRFV